MESALLIKRREAIILATIEAIDQYGVQAISTKEIAKKQGVSERIIFKHFPTKNDLLTAVLDHFAKYDDAIIETTLSKEIKALDAVLYFFDAYSTYYESYPAITSIAQSFSILLCNPDLNAKVKCIFTKHEVFIREKIREAQRLNIINSELSEESIANLMLGTQMRLCLKWRMRGYDFSFKETCMAAIREIIQLLKCNHDINVNR